MKLIVGLGNPGAKYKNTYHNVGWMVVDKFADDHGFKFKKAICDAEVAEGILDGEEVILAKPQTFMNASGISVKQLVKKYNVDESKDLVVVYDDVDLAVGTLRFRLEGSAGTHNGMRNIVSELDTQSFPRLRVGTRTLALKNKEIEVLEFVLSKIDYDTKQILLTSIDRACVALEEYINNVDFQRIIEKVNRKAKQENQ